MRKLTLGISTCPNDTFIFDAMINGKIETNDLVFECVLTDVEELNRKAFSSETDITKISYHAYAHVADNYTLLNSGSALGFNNGPLLVSANDVTVEALKGKKIAIPGALTTANLLLSILHPGLDLREEYLFSDIEDVTLKGLADAGLLIHENRFTYRAKGLKKVADLGEEWQSMTGMPIPLGGIAVRRDMDDETAVKVERILSESIDYAFKNPESPIEFIRKYAAAMDVNVMKRHIDLYVNEFSRDLGEYGRDAVRLLYSKAEEVKVITGLRKDIFLGD